MLSEHRDTFTDSQLDMLARTNSKAASRPFDLCPLCGQFPEDCHTLEDQKSKELPDNLPRHIAGHLKSLAMLSLPPRGVIEGTNEVTMAGDKREVEDSDADSISLTFSDLSIYRTFDINQAELDMERTWVLPERISLLTELPESDILIDPAWLEQDEYYYGERQDPWGISALFRLLEYPGGQDKDPRLASFRERVEKFKQQEDEVLVDGEDFITPEIAFEANVDYCQGTSSVPFQPYVEEVPNSYDSHLSFQSIVFQEPYRKFSPEELRWKDYVQERKFGNASGQASFIGAFGSKLHPAHLAGIGSTNKGSLSEDKPASDNELYELSSKANVGYCQGTSSVPFRPYIEKEPDSYDSHHSYFQSIVFQEPYRKFSPEELRWADYVQERKFGNASGQASFIGAFGSKLHPAHLAGIGSTNKGSLSEDKPASDNELYELSSKANVGYCQGTSSVPFRPYTQKEPNSYDNHHTSFQSIVFQEPYWDFSPEELRWADYVQGRKFGNASG